MSVRQSTPDRVAVETLQGDIRAGSVVDELVEADVHEIQRVFRVELDGTVIRVPEDDAGIPDDAATATRQ
ncbi:hypothetical protein [Haloarcula amylolytica]|uniref:Uncharacterized protein n=1 Tax=Haloarcula amylolytica JCM 13557 TaxID=1227452 RepID=M0K8P8_9EURY|nr:hypothetical protein [Haloarcula amylolytica]EMA17198.1 hypothetical protein C442_18050 [Haloarcula amylolytica JCM 13557]